jgi:hypothetical protein
LNAEGFKLISSGNKSGPTPQQNISYGDYYLAVFSLLYRIAQNHQLGSVEVFVVSRTPCCGDARLANAIPRLHTVQSMGSEERRMDWNFRAQEY